MLSSEFSKRRTVRSFILACLANCGLLSSEPFYEQNHDPLNQTPSIEVNQYGS